VKKVLGPSAVRDAAPSTIEVIASTGAVDRQNDRINPRGIRYENYLRNPTVLWAHDYTALPVGRALEVTASDRDLRAVIQFGPHTFAQEVYGLYRSGGLNAVSIGFTPLAEPKPNSFGGLDYSMVELLEISAVPVPANSEALVIARSIAGFVGEPREPYLIEFAPEPEEELVIEFAAPAPEDAVVFEFAPEPEPIRLGWPAAATHEPRFDVNPQWLADQIVRAAKSTIERKMTALTGRLPD
jgi:HK97 family phage prohead protease